MSDAHSNFAYGTVTVAPSPASSGLSLSVGATVGALLPTVPFNATVWPTALQPLSTNAEIVRVTANASGVLAIVRAQEGSSARSILVGDQFAVTITAKDLTDIETSITTETSRATTAEGLLAPLASPVLTGNPTAPTQTAANNSTRLATTAYADGAVSTEATNRANADALLAPLASPTFTGSPLAPTAAAQDSSTKIATTAFASRLNLQLIADASVPDGTTDNTTYLSGLLTTAISSGITLRIPKGAANWVLSHLVLPSGATVNATGATFVQPGTTNTRMIYNTSLTLGTPGSARDTNISWTGGTFVKGTSQTNVGGLGSLATGLDDHCTMFGFVDGLTVNNLTISQTGTGGNAGTGGRYGCYVYNCTNILVENFTATSASQSVNQSTLQLAYCQKGHIKGVYGTFGDDMVALVNGNGAGDLLTNGAALMENITVEDVFGTSPSTGVKLMPGSTTANTAPFYNLQRCKVLNVRGAFGSRGGTAAVFCGGSGSYATLQGGSLLDCEIQNVTQLQATTAAVYVTASAESHGIVLRGCNNLQDAAAVLIDTNGASAHSSVKVADCNYTTGITVGSYYPISVTGGTCRTLEIENVRLNAATTGTAIVGLVNGASGPGFLLARNCRGTGKVSLLGRFTSTTRICSNGCEQEDANGVAWFVTDTGAVVTVAEWGNLSGIGGTNTITRTAGSVAVTNASGVALPGANGTAILSGGTIVVNTSTGMVTAASAIRLTTLASGGTVGHCYVASRGTNTFTITSTSGTDTSTIFWEVVAS